MTRNVVCLCTDRNMAVPALYVATEAARRAGGAYDVHVFAEEGELDDQHRDWMKRHGIQALRGLSFPRLHATGATAGRIPPASLIRLLMPELLAERYDRLLYLDADTEICGDVAPLFELDLRGCLLAAAPAGRITPRTPPGEVTRHLRHFRALGMTEPYNFFNSGVMLIDVARWNTEDVGERALQFIERNPAVCKLPDEDALNAVVNGRILDLSPAWNFRNDVMQVPRSSEIVAPVIRHYDGPHKPWKRFSGERRLFALESANRRYREFVAGTPWEDWLSAQWTMRDLKCNLIYEGSVWFDQLLGRKRPGTRTKRQLRRYRKRWRLYLAEATFADVEQSITLRDGGYLRLNPAKARP